MKLWEWLLLGAFGLWAAIATYPAALGQLQSIFLPVMDKAVISNPRRERVGELEGIVFSAEANKSRECDWLRTEFFAGKRNGPSAFMPNAKHLDKPQGREVGPQYWDRIFVPVLEIDDLMTNIWADAVHDCGGIEVRSEFIN